MLMILVQWILRKTLNCKWKCGKMTMTVSWAKLCARMSVSPTNETTRRGNRVLHSRLPVSLHYCLRSSPVGLGTSTQLAQAADSLHMDVHHARKAESIMGQSRVLRPAGRWSALVFQHESSFTISPRSTTRPLYFWCFASNSAFFKWQMSISEAKWTFAPDVLAFYRSPLSCFWLSSGSTPKFSPIFPNPCPPLLLLQEFS